MYFKSSSDTQDIPPFPTRRSSDLFAVKGVMTDQTFARLYTNAAQYVPLSKNDLLVFRAEFGGVFTSGPSSGVPASRSEEHTSELQSRRDFVCRLLLEKKNATKQHH